MRLIDADAAKAKMIEVAAKISSKINIMTFPIVARLINMFDCKEDFPTIDAKPILHSKWISLNNSSHKFCESCGVEFNILYYKRNDYRFCPYCGACMDIEEEQHDSTSD